MTYEAPSYSRHVQGRDTMKVNPATPETDADPRNPNRLSMTKLEEIARALYAVWQTEDDLAFDDVLSQERDEYRALARAAVEALREPDEGMVEAMARALWPWLSHDLQSNHPGPLPHKIPWDDGETAANVTEKAICRDIARAAHQAMLTAILEEG